MKKFLLFIIFICLIIILIKFGLSNYTIEYKLDNYNVKTVYKNNRFYFEIRNGDYIYNFDSYSNRKFKYTKIDKIEEISNEEFNCIIPIIDDIKTYPLCYVGKEYTDYNLIDSELLLNYKVEKVNVEKSNKDFIYYNNLDNNEYVALWNYKGYIVMNGESYQIKNLFKKDKYDNSLAILFDDTIYMANNDEEHEYTSLIALNITNLKTKKIDLGVTIDFDSYFVGSVKNNIYIYDNKYNVLYEINVKNNKVNIVGNNEKGFVKYDGKKFVNCSKSDYKINKIKYNSIKTNYEYKSDNVTYKKYNENQFVRQKIINEKVQFINEKDNILYYYLKDSLFRYNPLNGSEKIFYYYELSFNSDNTIFVYNE